MTFVINQLLQCLTQNKYRWICKRYPVKFILARPKQNRQGCQGAQLWGAGEFWLVVDENPSVLKTFNFLATQERHCDAIFQWRMIHKSQPCSVKTIFWNIAKGTRDPRVEFISQDHSAQFTKLEHVTISKSRLSINFKISTKHQHLD